MSWTRRTFLQNAGLMSAGAPLLAQKGAAPRRPNIVLVLADGLGAWMVGCYGNQEFRTPNIDRLAAGGTRFHENLACSPVGSASRATLFTGRTPNQHGIQDSLWSERINSNSGQAAPPASFAKEIMLSDLLSEAGYRCGYVGKWGMGNDAKPGHGFSYTCTIGSGSYQNPSLHINGSSVDEKGYLAEVLTRRACEFIDQQTKGSPFFLTVGYPNPSDPSDGHPQKYYDLYKGRTFDSFAIEPAAPSALGGKEYLANSVENLRKVAASVTALDDQIPALQRKLIDKGLFDNTLIIFTSDNGSLLGRHGLWGDGYASNPINMYSEVVEVPMIWQWPGQLPVAAVRPELASHYDFLPTLCEATGVKAPASANLCGRSYLPAITNRHFPKKDPWLELVFGQCRNTEMARDTYYKLVARNEGQGPNEFYAVRKDPRERANLYDDPGFVTVRDQLAKQLAAWRQKY